MSIKPIICYKATKIQFYQAQTKFGDIAGAISKAIQKDNISPNDFHKILDKVDKHRKLKKRYSKKEQNKRLRDYKRAQRKDS